MEPVTDSRAVSYVNYDDGKKLIHDRKVCKICSL